MDELQSEGIFYNPDNCTASEIETMRAYAEQHGLKFMTLNEFLETIFYRLHFFKNCKEGEVPRTLPTMIIGHNLAFDLGTLSYDAAPSRGSNYGGLTLKLAEGLPDIIVKKIGFGKHLFSVHQSWNKRRNLRFTDTMQLGRALLGPGELSIEGLLKNLNIKRVTKGKANYDGPIDAEYVDY